MDDTTNNNNDNIIKSQSGFASNVLDLAKIRNERDRKAAIVQGLQLMETHRSKLALDDIKNAIDKLGTVLQKAGRIPNPEDDKALKRIKTTLKDVNFDFLDQQNTPDITEEISAAKAKVPRFKKVKRSTPVFKTRGNPYANTGIVDDITIPDIIEKKSSESISRQLKKDLRKKIVEDITDEISAAKARIIYQYAKKRRGKNIPQFNVKKDKSLISDAIVNEINNEINKLPEPSNDNKFRGKNLPDSSIDISKIINVGTPIIIKKGTSSANEDVKKPSNDNKFRGKNLPDSSIDISKIINVGAIKTIKNTGNASNNATIHPANDARMPEYMGRQGSISGGKDAANDVEMDSLKIRLKEWYASNVKGALGARNLLGVEKGSKTLFDILLTYREENKKQTPIFKNILTGIFNLNKTTEKVGEETKDAIKESASDSNGILGSIGSVMGGLGKAVPWLLGGAAVIDVATGLIGNAEDYQNTSQKLANGEISKAESDQLHAESVGNGLGSVGGAVIGGTLGRFAGSILGPMGMIGGGWVGSKIGGYLGGAIGKYSSGDGSAEMTPLSTPKPSIQSQDATDFAAGKIDAEEYTRRQRVPLIAPNDINSGVNMYNESIENNMTKMGMTSKSSPSIVNAPTNINNVNKTSTQYRQYPRNQESSMNKYIGRLTSSAYCY